MKTAFAAASGDVHVRIDDSGNEQFSGSVNHMTGWKRERDAVLNAFRGFIQSGHLCEYCADTLKDDPACSACEKWSKFQWRGPEEDRP